MILTLALVSALSLTSPQVPLPDTLASAALFAPTASSVALITPSPSVAGLFAVNTVTGGLNAFEAHKDPEEKTRRTLHSVLMAAADAGFVATGLLAGGHEDGVYLGSSNPSLHRNVAPASMRTVLVRNAIMLPVFRRD